MNWVALIIQLVSGAVGGNIVGGVVKNLNLGTLGNSIAGIVGGGLGGQLMNMAGVGASGGMDIAGIVSQIAAGGVGGGVLMAIVGVIKKAMAR